MVNIVFGDFEQDASVDITRSTRQISMTNSSSTDFEEAHPGQFADAGLGTYQPQNTDVIGDYDVGPQFDPPMARLESLMHIILESAQTVSMTLGKIKDITFSCPESGMPLLNKVTKDKIKFGALVGLPFALGLYGALKSNSPLRAVAISTIAYMSYNIGQILQQRISTTISNDDEEEMDMLLTEFNYCDGDDVTSTLFSRDVIAAIPPGRISPPRRQRYTIALVHMAKARFGILNNDLANQAVVRFWMYTLLNERGVRPSHQNPILDRAMHLFFLLTEDEARTRRMMSSRLANQARDAAHVHYRPTVMDEGVDLRRRN